MGGGGHGFWENYLNFIDPLDLGYSPKGGSWFDAWGTKKKDADLPPVETDPEELTGKIDEESAAEIARKRIFRSGTVFTSAAGLYGDTGNTTQARLK